MSYRPEFSVLIPAKDEAGNLPRLLHEIEQACRDIDYEVIVIDDGSSDATWRVLSECAARDARLRPFRHERSAGQSTSVWQAAYQAHGEWLGTLDGDGQNDPADLPAMLERARQGDVAMVAGQRVQRNDDWIKRVSSRVANGVRAWMLKDATPDTGCGIKVMRRDVFLRLPYFNHMHRFLPALVRAQGEGCISWPVGHRARQAGVSKYATWDRLKVGVVDLFGVAWLQRRSRLPAPLLTPQNSTPSQEMESSPQHTTTPHVMEHKA
ncbi:glycosyltransferase family 2 protein [Phytohalomonas tamaricis]|uniref:glycosyltransferase family 2 protein n=1 Tax=Phytohalomonas tamaricis TaxID=2081032 RepID=UPI000D0BBF12|nr:glycosyltransferase family 2 protein [Phytohalomonas tamaricis]